MLSTARIAPGRAFGILAILLIALSAGACMGGAASAPGATAGAAYPGGLPAAAPTQAGGNDGDGNGDGSGGDEIDQLSPGQEGLQIIKTGTMSLQVAEIDAALAAATHQVNAIGGYISGSDRSGDGDTAQASVTFRIPAARWDEALTGLRSVAEKVLLERSSTEDVTTQIVDLAARIKNLETTETALQVIMDRAADIEDILTVQDRLTTVRGQIEQLVAQRTSLEGRAAFSTLTVTFSLKPAPPVAVAQEGFNAGAEAEAATARLVGLLQGLATAGIWFGIVWLPILLTLALVAIIGVAIGRRVLGRVAGGEETPLPSAGSDA